MITLSFALPEESKGLVALLEKPVRSGPPALPVIAGVLSGVEVEIVHTGMGAASAESRLEALFEKQKHPRVLVAAGFGGALAPDLRVGDLILAANYSDPALARKLQSPALQVGPLVSVEEVVETHSAKARLAHDSGAVCVDMETAVIFRHCKLRGIPMVAVRAISDGAHDDLPVPATVWFDAVRQRPRPAALVGHLLAHPAKIFPFARFVRGIHTARAALTKFLAGAVAVLDNGG